MGGRHFRPQIEVTEDPDVVIYTHVGFSVLLSQRREFFALSNAKSLVSSGLLYVRDKHLHHVPTHDSGPYSALVGYQWKLSDITHMEMVNGNVTITKKDRHHGNTQENHYIDPGLRVVFKNRKVLVTAMPDAETFCAQLSLHIDQLYCHKRTRTHKFRHPLTRQKGNYRLSTLKLQRTSHQLNKQ